MVILASLASGARAGMTLTPNASGFGAINIGSVSQISEFTLTVYCDYDFDLQQCIGSDSFSPEISFDPPGEFIETNDCPETLNGVDEFGEGCTIDVQFAPTSLGQKDATLRTGEGGLTALVGGNGVVPVELDLDARAQRLRRTVTLFATSNHDSSLSLDGRAIEPTVTNLVADERTTVKARLKRAVRKRLDRKLDKRGKAKIKIPGTATEPTNGRSADDRVTIRFRR